MFESSPLIGVTISTRVAAAHQPRTSGESTATNVFRKILLTFVEIGREYARFLERSRLPPLPNNRYEPTVACFATICVLRPLCLLVVGRLLTSEVVDFEMKLTCCMFLGSCLLGDMANVVRLRR